MTHVKYAPSGAQGPISKAIAQKPQKVQTGACSNLTPLQIEKSLSNSPKNAYRIVRISELCKLTGLSRSMVYEKTNPSSAYYDPTFPCRIHLGARAVGFLESDIEAWIKSRIDKTEQIKAA